MSGDPRPLTLPPAVLDAMPGAVAQLGSAGEILGVNARWRALAGDGYLVPGTNVTLAANYVDAWVQAAAIGAPAAADVVEALRAVLSNESTMRSLDVTTRKRSFAIVVARLAGDGYDGALVIHTEADPEATGGSSRNPLTQRKRHEFANLLTVVLGYGELLRDNRELPESCRTAVGEILDAARRASDLMALMSRSRGT